MADIVSPSRTATGRSRATVSRSERLCMWSAVAIAIVMSGGFLVAGLIPPPDPAASPTDLHNYYFDNPTAMRAGLSIMLLGATFIMPFGIAMAQQIRRVEGPQSPMAALQVASTATVVIATYIYLFMLLTAVYRDDRSPALIQLISDLAWIPFIGMWQPGALQAIAVAVAVLGDRSPDAPGHWPRWVGWVSLWYAFTSLVGTFVPFTLGGALSWNGAIPFYLGAAALFGFWVVVAIPMLRGTQAIRPLDTCR